MAKDPEVKFNSYVGLMAVARKMLEVDSKALGEYVVALTDYRKHCGGKKTEMESYAIGRLLVIKALKKYFEGDLSVMESVVGMMADFVCFEEQILEVAFLIATDKKTRIVFIKAGPTTKAGAMFHKILCSKLKKNHL